MDGATQLRHLVASLQCDRSSLARASTSVDHGLFLSTLPNSSPTRTWIRWTGLPFLFSSWHSVSNLPSGGGISSRRRTVAPSLTHAGILRGRARQAVEMAKLPTQERVDVGSSQHHVHDAVAVVDIHQPDVAAIHRHLQLDCKPGIRILARHGAGLPQGIE